MNPHTPSFLRLFERSGYYRCAQMGDESEEAQKERKECERFAVATVAFCLKYDRKFLKHFWKTICRVPGDPFNMPPDLQNGIAVEPHHWADLQLVSRSQKTKFVWVVEFKAGAKLAGKQRPDNPEFRSPGIGYGHLFANAEEETQTRLRYIILGSRDSRDFDTLKVKSGDVCKISVGNMHREISLQSRTWDDLAADLWSTGVVHDLLETLGELRIAPFYMDKIKKLSVKTPLRGVGHAYEIMEAVCDHLKVRSSYYQFDAGDHDGENGCVGFYIRQPPPLKSPSARHIALQKVTRLDGWCVAWLGYEYTPKIPLRKAVWLYTNTPADQKHLLKKMKAKYEANEGNDGPKDFCVVIRSMPGDDFEWFKSVFDYAINPQDAAK